MKLPVAVQRGFLNLPRIDAPLRLSALARREVKAGEIFFMPPASGEELIPLEAGQALKTAFGGLKLLKRFKIEKNANCRG